MARSTYVAARYQVNSPRGTFHHPNGMPVEAHQRKQSNDQKKSSDTPAYVPGKLKLIDKQRQDQPQGGDNP